jgi:ketosteroid isomerase-like protein
VTGAEVVRRYLDALNRRDLTAMLELVDPDVEIHGPRGVRRGREGLQTWLGEPYVELDVEREVDRMHVEGPVVVAVGRIRHCWRESGEVGDETESAWLVELAGGRIKRYEAFTTETDALAAAGMAPEDTPP